MSVWPVQDAKARLSEIIKRAQTEGPQMIARHGTEQAVVVSARDDRLLSSRRPDFVAFLLGDPKVEEFVVPRDKDLGRDAPL